MSPPGDEDEAAEPPAEDEREPRVELPGPPPIVNREARLHAIWQRIAEAIAAAEAKRLRAEDESED